MTLCVLTGDLIRSTDLPPGRLARAMDVLAHEAQTAAPWLGANPLFTRQRGDGWQACVRPVFGLRLALLMRAALRAEGKDLSTRIALAEGAGSLGDGQDLNTASGPAFTASGRALDALSPPALMIHASGGALGAAVRLADHISTGWSVAQARAIVPYLAPDPPLRREAAARLGISRQAVDQALEAAGYPALNTALQMIEGDA